MAPSRRRNLKATPIRSVLLELVLADFTNSGGTTGTYDATSMKLPLGSKVLGVKIVGGDFSGDTTASVDVGNSSNSWMDAVKTGYAAAFPVTSYGRNRFESQAVVQTAATATPRVTITGGASFASIVADSNAIAKAKVYVEVYYLDLNARSI